MSLRLRGAAVLLVGIGAWAADEPPRSSRVSRAVA